jgi:hypothetical protein
LVVNSNDLTFFNFSSSHSHLWFFKIIVHLIVILSFVSKKQTIMPHLQDQSESKSHEGSGILMGSARGNTVEDHLPIKDAKTGFFEGTSDPVIAMANKTKTAMDDDKIEEVSFDSSDGASPSSCTPAGNRASKTQVTPSPTNGSSQKRLQSTSMADVALGSPKSSTKSGAPILTIYGNSRLFHSPIRVKRRVSHSEDDEKEDGSSTESPQELAMSDAQPAHLRYANEAPTVESSRPILIRRGSSLGKRFVSDDQQPAVKAEEGPATKKSKTEGEDAAAAAAMEAAVEAASAMAGMRKKPVISPTSSAADKGDDNEQHGSRPNSFYDHRLHPYSYPPHAHHHGMPPYGHIHPSASFGYGGYPMYPGYPHHGHYSGFYPPYPSPQASAMHAYRQRPPFPGGTVAVHMAPKAVLSRSTSNLEGTSTTAEEKGSPKSKVTPSPNTNFKSLSDWQNATMLSVGNAPSANRCVPLKEPVPAKYWG